MNRLTVTLLATVLLAACTHDPDQITNPPPVGSRILVTFDPPSPIGGLVVTDIPERLVGTVVDAAGDTIVGATVTWRTIFFNAGTVDASGLIVPTGPGNLIIEARSEALVDTLYYAIRSGIDHIQFEPPSIGLLPEANTDFVQRLLLATGESIIDVGVYTLIYGVRDSSIVSLTPAPLLDSDQWERATASTKAGTTYVIGKVGSHTDSLRIDVTPVAAVDLSMAYHNGCIVAASDGRPWCWGDDLSDLLSPYPGYRTGTPAGVAHLNSVSQISIGQSGGCALKRDQTIWCWGRLIHGELGRGSIQPGTAPGPIDNAGPWLALGYSDVGVVCAIDAAHSLWCWGGDGVNPLVAGQIDALSPTLLPSVPGPVVQVAASGQPDALHICARTGDGSAWCWGHNEEGQVGVAAGDVVTTPVRVEGLPPLRSISVGMRFTCAIDVSGDAWCWGSDSNGQLGGDAGESTSIPQKVSAPVTFVSVSAGTRHACAIAVDGTVWCWGANDAGQLGLGNTIFFKTPTQILSSSHFVRLSSIALSTCGLSIEQGLVCWGTENDFPASLTPRAISPYLTTDASIASATSPAPLVIPR